METSARTWGRRHIKPLKRLPRRLRAATSRYAGIPSTILRWLFTSNEIANFTYDLTDRNKDHLAAIVAVVSGTDEAVVRRYLVEADEIVVPALRAAIPAYRAERLAAGNCYLDPEVHIGRRLGWYAAARALKPRLVVETGVDHGFGSVTLCAALRRNSEEGFPGRYIGTDIDPHAGALFGEQWRALGEIVIGDSIGTLAKLDGPIDLFVNDSDHSADYERREYLTIKANLSPRALVIGDNAHVTDELLRFSRAEGRRFLFFREQPRDHWYPGAGIGFSFNP